MEKERIPAEELCVRFKALYSGLLSDIMDAKGHWNHILPKDIVPIRQEWKIAGLAFTGLGRAVDDTTRNDHRKRIQMLGEIPAWAVVVWDAAGHEGAAHWGEMMSLASRNQGSQGAVINGGTRDTAQVLGMDFPVFARFRSPASSIGRWEIIEWQKSIRIGTVTINPGDYVFGDIDGVVVIPQEMTVEVLLEGEKLFTTERKMQEALRGGMTIRAAYEKFGTF